MSASVGSILLDLGLNTAPITAQVRGAAARTQTQLKGAFSGVGAQASKVAGGIGQKFSSLFVKLGSLMTAAFAFGRIKAMALLEASEIVSGDISLPAIERLMQLLYSEEDREKINALDLSMGDFMTVLQESIAAAIGGDEKN